MAENKLRVVKATLSSGKVVFLRELKISDTEMAAQAVAPKSNGDSNVLQLLMQKELLKLVLVKVGDKTPSASEKEDLDSIFTLGEYGQVLKVIGKMSGGDDMGKEPTLEFTTA